MRLKELSSDRGRHGSLRSSCGIEKGQAAINEDVLELDWPSSQWVQDDHQFVGVGREPQRPALLQ
jgi:hypothetical protein